MIVHEISSKLIMRKGTDQRSVKASRVKEYQTAGWKTAQSGAGEEVIRLKPPAKKSKAAEPPAEEANDNIQGDTSWQF